MRVGHRSRIKAAMTTPTPTHPPTHPRGNDDRLADAEREVLTAAHRMCMAQMNLEGQLRGHKAESVIKQAYVMVSACREDLEWAARQLAHPSIRSGS